MFLLVIDLVQEIYIIENIFYMFYIMMSIVNVPFIEIERFKGKDVIPWKLSPVAIQEIFSVLKEGEEIAAVLAEDIAPTSPRKLMLEEADWKEFILCTLEDRKKAGQIINCRIVDPRADND